MRRIGFSTGALAYGDFERGIALQSRADVEAIELSALRMSEVEPLIAALPHLSLSGFEYVAFHAPSVIPSGQEEWLVQQLESVLKCGYPIILHPDAISDIELWRPLSAGLLLENMDQRKPVCRTADEMRPFFAALPEAGFCFDIGHARQVDPTMSVAAELLQEFGERLTEVHISEVNEQCRHISITRSAMRAFRFIAPLIPDDTPAIIESVISESEIDEELSIARQCLASYVTRSLQPAVA